MCSVALGSNISVTASFVWRCLTSLELLPLSAHRAHSWTCPRLDPVAFDPMQKFAPPPLGKTVKQLVAKLPRGWNWVALCGNSLESQLSFACR
jgi:hypothetical protein